MNIIEVGVDLVSIERIKKITNRYPERFIDRILSEPEKVLYLERGGKVETLASAFAAKEAVLKALGCGIGPAALNEVNVLTRAGCKPGVTLTGAAARFARQRGIENIAISTTHEPPFACAIAVAYI